MRVESALHRWRDWWRNRCTATISATFRSSGLPLPFATEHAGEAWKHCDRDSSKAAPQSSSEAKARVVRWVTREKTEESG